MTINRYRAKSLKAAIQKAKTDLGVDAKMIHLRQLDDCEDKIEIIAIVDDDVDAPETQDARLVTRYSSLVTLKPSHPECTA